MGSPPVCKGLNTLELASSGRVAVTTNDKHALDIQVLEHPDMITIIHISTSRTMDDCVEATRHIGCTTKHRNGGGVNDTILTSINNVDIVATETITLAAANLNADFTDNASIQAPSVDITASAGDVVIASGNNLTLTVKNDRIVVDGDIDLTGQINAASTTIIETSTTTDNYIDIQDGLNIEVTGGSLGSQGAPDSNCSTVLRLPSVI
jgi:hypothetical protein